jgi:DNA end-binding protein Ku
MPPRASWKGQLRLSLVSIPVCLYNAVSSTSRISMNQLHKGCHRRLRQQMVCPEHGHVERSDIVKGYEYEKERFVIVEEAELESIRLETNKTIEILQFIEAGELDPLYFDAPYFVAPDGPVAAEAFRVLREGMRASRKIALGRVVMSSREHPVALQVQERGLRLTTLRSCEEVRSSQPYFEGLRDGEVAPDQLALAEQLIESKVGALDLARFRDRYQDVLLDMLKAKIAGTPPVIVQEAEVGRVINLMDALKQSLAGAGRKKPPAASVKAPRRERKARSA